MFKLQKKIMDDNEGRECGRGGSDGLNFVAAAALPKAPPSAPSSDIAGNGTIET